MRYFEKINFERFKKDIVDDIKLYDEYPLPKRSTKASAGYDFCALANFTINPGETKKIPTGVKANMESDEVLFLIIRSSMGFKYNIRLCNHVGVIDKDYYNNPDNEGHMWLCLKNEGEKPYEIKKFDKICQGIFIKYQVVDDEEEIKNIRCGGIGSTSKEDFHE